MRSEPGNRVPVPVPYYADMPAVGVDVASKRGEERQGDWEENVRSS